MTRVKICGVTTLNEARLAAKAGADFLGLNFYPPSPRSLTPEVAWSLVSQLRGALGEGCPLLVGVFVNEPNVAAIVKRVGLDAAQFSGDEPPAALVGFPAFKGIRPESDVVALQQVRTFAPTFPVDERLPSLLLDAHHPALYGGTGEQAPDAVVEAVKAQVPRLMLAGGLRPENVAERVKAAQPWGVDVASGVESAPGVKDSQKVKAFIEAVKGI